MKLLFLHFTKNDYDVTTPYERAIGGSESALCYLCVELARRGHDVVLATNTSRPREALGVTCMSTQHLGARESQCAWDAVIVLNGPAAIVRDLKPYLRPEIPLVLWTQHAADQSQMFGLADPAIRAGWDKVVCLSTFHRNQLIAHYHLDPERVMVLANGIAPAFENLFSSVKDLQQAKGERPILAYTSTPFRGLEHLLSLYREVYAVHPSALLRVYSSMQVYSVPVVEDEYRALYERARDMAGIEYVGSLPQPELARQLREASLLAYPNTFAETYCISAVEALAAGLSVVTTDLGALPETLMGHGVLVPALADADDLPAFCNRYREQLTAEITFRLGNPEAFATRQFAQVQLVNERCQYRIRAAQWEVAIADFPRP